ncbi:MAG: hypothetical protein QXT88_05045 [Desulfurococcaceae archaeon]
MLNQVNSFENVLDQKLSMYKKLSVIIVSRDPWVLPTVIGRLEEEYGLKLFVLLTSKHVVEDVEKNLDHVKDFDVDIVPDYLYAQNIVRDNVFDTTIYVSKIMSKLNNNAEEIFLDLTCTDSSLASTITYIVNRVVEPTKIMFTLVDGIHLYGVPAYPGSPRWLHKVYLHGVKKISENEKRTPVTPPKQLEWRGSRGIYIGFSKLLNSLTKPNIYEYFDGSQRYVPEVLKDDVLTIYSHSNRDFNEKYRLITIKPYMGPDETTSSMIYSSWKTLSDILSKDFEGINKQAIDRILMQIQRYTGSTDLVIKQIASMNGEEDIPLGEKLHRVLYSLATSKQRVDLVFDTNLFYQGIHMSLLKTSIRLGNPWNVIYGLNLYVPLCAEMEINSKVAKLNPDNDGLPKLYYIMSLLANRSLLETRYHYGAQNLEAVGQPCEVSIGVEAQSLPGDRIYLVTADHRGFTAWQTLNVCRGRVTCIYIGHSDKPLDANTLYSKLYVSVALSQLVYVSSMFTPISINYGNTNVSLTIKSLKGSNAPVIGINWFRT